MSARTATEETRMNKPKRKDIQIKQMDAPDITVPASVYGALAVHGNALEGWTLTHVPSGMRFVSWNEEWCAREACHALLALRADWAALTPAQIEPLAPGIKAVLAPWVPRWNRL